LPNHFKTMKRYLAHISLVVADYDDAIEFYCDDLALFYWKTLS
jgi:catechol 2,3-dioxygenase-like lactoylglutathione lyase family enzyme